MKTRAALILIALACSAAIGFAQEGDVAKTGTVAAPFLEIPVGAPAIGMGGAFVSLATDATSLYWNPAGAANLATNEVVAQHTRWIAETKFDFAALVLPLGSFGTLGFSFTSLSMPDMKVRTVELPEGTGEYFTAGDLAVGVSYARQLSDRFSIGFTGKYIQETIWHESANAIAIDVGTTFRTDLIGGLTIGATIMNFGTTMQMSGRDTRQFIRVDPTKEGSNGQIPTNIELNSWDLPLLIQIGISTTPVNTDNYRWTLAVDAMHPSDDYESMNVGTEFAYQKFLFVRGGYNSLFLKTKEGGLSFGVGVASTPLFEGVTVRFDYAYRDMGRLENIQVLSLGVLF
jgi:hypothetical protein